MRILLTTLAIAGGGYLLLCLLLYLLQERMVFLSRIPGRTLEATPQLLGLAYDDVTIETSDGIPIHGWYVHADDPRGTILFLHGNAGNISHRLDSIAIFNELGFDTFIFDYRGYGQSGGSTSEEGTYVDAESAWLYLVEQRGVAPHDIVIFGRSLGGAIASWLAARYDAGGVIVESSFTSAADMAASLYPFLPARYLVRLKYPADEYIAHARSPVLVVHSRDDEIIPFHMGEALYGSAPEPKELLELSGDHNTGFYMNRVRYTEGLSRFLSLVSRRRPASS